MVNHNELYEYWPIVSRPPLTWPGGARVAFWLGVNIEHYLFGKPSLSLAANTAQFVPDPQNHAWRDYGPRVGIWRLVESLDRYSMRASVLLNSDVCAEYPEIIAAGNQRGWAWLAHGKNNSTLQVNMEPDAEHAYLAGVVDTIERSTGRRPKGWLGPGLTETSNTPAVLAGLGLTYDCDWCCDDQPFPMNAGTTPFISVPYGLELNDITMFLGKSMSGEQFYQQVADQLETLVADGESAGRVMCLALHPMIINQPFRHKYLDAVLKLISAHDKVWVTTSDEIADWYLANYYDVAIKSMREGRAAGAAGRT